MNEKRKRTKILKEHTSKNYTRFHFIQLLWITIFEAPSISFDYEICANILRPVKKKQTLWNKSDLCPYVSILHKIYRKMINLTNLGISDKCVQLGLCHLNQHGNLFYQLGGHFFLLIFYSNLKFYIAIDIQWRRK